jgi:hypothetical protein
MSDNSEDNTNIEVNNLSKYEQASNRFRSVYSKWREYEDWTKNEFDTMFRILLDAGLSKMNAIKKIVDDHRDLKGFSQASIYRRLDPQLKGPTKPGPHKNKLSNDNLLRKSKSKATLVVDKEPYVPPIPPTYIQPAEEPEPIKAKHQEAFMSFPLAKHLMGLAGLSRLIGTARADGYDRIRFKINEQGDLYLP